MPAPSRTRFEQLVAHGRDKGLDQETARAYATLGWWLEHYPYRAPTITDGYRSPDVQRRAYDHWRRTGNNLAGQPVPSIAPPGTSFHERRRAFDLNQSDPWVLEVLGLWAPYAGLGWGGTWRNREPWHFERR